VISYVGLIEEISMVRRHIGFLIGLQLILAMPMAFCQSPSPSEITHLLNFVEQSGCRFKRNSRWYESHEARLHLEHKRDYLAKRGMLTDAESFILRAASQSSMSGQPYLVQCPNGPELPSSTWLTNELLHHRSAPPPAN
jgi:hypothetical protein